MNLQDRVAAFAKLGTILKETALSSFGSDIANISDLQGLIDDSVHYNPWFTPENVRYCLQNWGEALTEENLQTWLRPYALPEFVEPKKIGVVMAGNIPMVGFHDLLCILLSGHRAIVKCSSSDNHLLPAIFERLIDIDSRFSEQAVFTEGLLKEADAFIATGSDNSARYFNHYFQKFPHIIRRHRNSVAVLTGDETEEDLKNLGEDVFRYFGLGCRNVSKLFVPENYDFTQILELFSAWRDLDNHHKYHNNFDYNKAIALINRDNFIDGGFFILKPNPQFSSPISVLHYERYNNLKDVKLQLEQNADALQCVVSNTGFLSNTIPFGKAQKPNLWDYADGVDTLAFLARVNA